MKTPVHRLGWTGVFVLAAIASAGAQDICRLSDVAVCRSFAPGLKVGCTKHVQLAVAFCRKAARVERFGSHEDHCKAACRAGVQAFKLELGLQEYAMTTTKGSALGDEPWLNTAQQYWQAMASPEAICTTTQFDEAKSDCENHCTKKARRRDLEELQGLSKGNDFLAIQQPVFGCPPGPATKLFSGSHDAAVPHLYAPGHQRRSGTAAE